MKRYDVTLKNPTAEQVQAAVEAGREYANRGVRQRLVDDGDCNVIVERIVGSRDGQCERDGGGVANSYGYRAESSVVAAAWYTDGRTKWVRIRADRIGCSGRHVSSLLPGTRAQHETMLPKDFVVDTLLDASTMRKLREGKKCEDAGVKILREAAPMIETIDAAKDADEANAAWGVFADWLQDRGAVKLAGLIQRQMKWKMTVPTLATV